MCDDAWHMWSDKRTSTTRYAEVTSVTTQTDESPVLDTLYLDTFDYCWFKMARTTKETALATITKTYTFTNTYTIFTQVSSRTITESPRCSIHIDDCNELWFNYASARRNWNRNSSDMWTIQLAEPPTSMVFNGVTKSFPGGAMSAPVITIGGETYYPVTFAPTGKIPQNHTVSYNMGLVFSSTNLSPATLTPGMSTTWSKKVDEPQSPDCTPSLSTGARGHSCTIGAGDVRLLYFPQTSTSSRDLCATSLITESWVTSLPTDIIVGMYFFFSLIYAC